MDLEDLTTAMVVAGSTFPFTAASTALRAVSGS
jgi:hypothetical protein